MKQNKKVIVGLGLLGLLILLGFGLFFFQSQTLVDKGNNRDHSTAK